MCQLRERALPLDKFLFLEGIRDSNAQLYYALLVTFTDELLPIVYTPVVGEFCQKYHKVFRPTPRGLYVSLKDQGKVKSILRKWPLKGIRVIVVTDGERILGLGDLGCNGMGIPLGKIAMYTALGGIPPEFCLAVTLDVGTNNESLLMDPAYIGLRQPRCRGPEYDALVAEFMEAAMETYGPRVLVQFEDFGNVNAFRLLDRWGPNACAFNDDIQGTACVVLAGLQASRRITGRMLQDETFLFFGAGAAAIGIADLIAYSIARETGVSVEEGRNRIWLFDSKGLVVASRIAAMPEQKHRYAHEHEELAAFIDAVRAIRPTAIVGVSTVAKAFNEEVLRTMSELNDLPLIFPLSNPTSKSECTFAEAMQATGGRCVFASGSPFPPYQIDDRIFIPGQANNAFIFGGIGLAVLASGIERITTEDFYCAATALAAIVPEYRLASGCLFPAISSIRDSSAAMAAGICKNAQAKGRLNAPEQEDWFSYCSSIMYSPITLEYDTR